MRRELGWAATTSMKPRRTGYQDVSKLYASSCFVSLYLVLLFDVLFQDEQRDIIKPKRMLDASIAKELTITLTRLANVGLLLKQCFVFSIEEIHHW